MSYALVPFRWVRLSEHPLAEPLIFKQHILPVVLVIAAAHERLLELEHMDPKVGRILDTLSHGDGFVVRAFISCPWIAREHWAQEGAGVSTCMLGWPTGSPPTGGTQWLLRVLNGYRCSSPEGHKIAEPFLGATVRLSFVKRVSPPSSTSDRYLMRDAIRGHSAKNQWSSANNQGSSSSKQGSSANNQGSSALYMKKVNSRGPQVE